MKKKPFYRFSGNIIIRLLVGIIFLLEGIQKILFPDMNGVGRFVKIGIPYPYFFGPFVGLTEIICSVLIIIGLYTRLAAVPLFIIIITAILITKTPLFIDKNFWFITHESRTDFCMLMGLIFLLLFGSGKFSIDIILIRHKKSRFLIS